MVAKLYLCPAGSSSYHWTGCWGCCALVVDRSFSLPSKHIQLFDLHSLHRHLNVQLYESMTYLAPNHLFHTFEIEVKTPNHTRTRRAGTEDRAVAHWVSSALMARCALVCDCAERARRSQLRPSSRSA